MDARRAGVVVYELTSVIKQNRDYLSEIDGATGDGDHGVNMNKGFNMCREQLEGKADTIGFAGALDTLGNILLSEIGGSMGPLYGSFFMEMAESIQGKDSIGANDYLAMLDAGLSGIMSIVSTQLGDKTLLDALVPAIGAFRAALLVDGSTDGADNTGGAGGVDNIGVVGSTDGADDAGGVGGTDGAGDVFGQALAAHKAAAQAGREATKDMAAKVGRASRMGERSRGFYDAGATSCALILASMADSVTALLE